MKISYYLPSEILTNDMLEKIYNNPSWTASKIYRKTGIKSRHIAGNELVSQMAVSAAQNLFKEYDLDPVDIDFVLLCTQSPDYQLPTTACIVQAKLGIPTSAGAMDFNLGCSGYIYGLAVAKGLLCSDIAKQVLLITSECYTSHINKFDRSTRTVFGDGASATLMTKKDVDRIGSFVLGSDGKGAPNLIIEASGLAVKKTDKTKEDHTDQSGNIRNQENIYMNGPEIFAFTLRQVPELIDEVLTKNSCTYNDIRYFVFHQANKLVLNSLKEKLEIPDEKFLIDVETIGNTVSSTIPIALKRMISKGEIKLNSGDKILLAGFGVGYSWGATILTYKEEI